jgi:transcriptional regulator with XRE-family HTH domain
MNRKILKRIIVYLGLTQREFAKQIGSNEVQVSKWLSGTRNISQSKLQEILTQFSLKISFEILAQ